jgi:hypothetical protein
VATLWNPVENWIRVLDSRIEAWPPRAQGKADLAGQENGGRGRALTASDPEL